MKDFFDFVKEKAGFNQPFCLQDIKNPDYSYDNLRKKVSNWVKEGRITRFSQGVYYIPSPATFGFSEVDPGQVIQKKYLGDPEKVFGFSVGLWFENALGMTQQVPMALEIVTNQEKSKKRTVQVGFRQVILRRPLTPIDPSNFKYLQILEYLRLRDITRMDENRLTPLRQFVAKEKLSRAKMVRFSSLYPATVSKRLLESGLIDVLA